MTATSLTPVSEPAATQYKTLGAAWIPLVALCLSFLVEMVDNTILTIALPTIGRDLGAGTTELQWITGAYSLTFGGLLLSGGALADRLGRRRILLCGLAGFGAVSALVPLVGSVGGLIALRAALGVAAAAMAPVSASLVFRLFEDETLRMRAMTIIMIVGMSGFALGPVVAGTALAHFPWQWLLLINVPIAIIAWVGVRLGVPADRAEDLHPAPLDLPGAALSVLGLSLAIYTFTSGVDHGWASAWTLASAIGAVTAIGAFIVRERTAAHPMLDLALFRVRTIRGAALAQAAASVAMIGSMFGLVLHFQYAYGWSPMLAGLANLPFIVTMIAATPIAEKGVQRLGHRTICLLAVVLLAAALGGLAAGLDRGYLPIAVCMVALTIGLRVIMTVCAIALIDAMPQNRTSIGAALNDTAQELGTSFGVATVGTVLAVVGGGALPDGVWSPAMVAGFFHGERVAYLVIALFVAVVGGYGAGTLTASRNAEEAH